MEAAVDDSAQRASGIARLSFRTADPEEARRVIEQTYYPNVLDVLDREHRLSAVFDIVRRGPVTVGDLRCGADVRLDVGELGAYHVNVPMTGRLSWYQGEQASGTTAPGRATVFGPRGATGLDRWPADCRVLAVKIGRRELVRHLEGLLGRPVSREVRLAPELDVSQGAGRSWARLARLVAGDSDDPQSLLHQPLIAGRLQESLLTGLLLACGHRYQEELRRPAPAAVAPRAVERVREAIHAHPEHPYTTGELAGIAQVGVRRLQEEFRRYVGMSPMAYLRDVRMTRVRAELAAGDPDRSTVGTVAYKWGFAHLGRFAASYRARFGELPSQTLNSP